MTDQELDPQASEAVQTVHAVLSKIAAAFGPDVAVEVREDEEGVSASLEGEDSGRIIGHHGATLDAIQHLASRIAFRGPTGRRRLVVDAAGYRGKRATSLERAADQAVATAEQSGRPVVLEAMSASERRVVHEYLKDHPSVETYSQGDEPDRRLVVAPLVD